MKVVLALVVMSGVASASPTPVWLGVLRGGSVRALTPVKGDPATGAVHVVQPLLGKTADGTVDKGIVAGTFTADPRDGADTVLLVPAAATVSFVAVGKADTAAIKAVLKRDAALSGVGKALVGLELAGVALDGAKQPDIAMSYGCTTWADGECQSKGTMVFVRRAGRWSELE